MKYLFITLSVQDGENRHTHRVLHTTNGTNIDFVAQLYASRYYGQDGERFDDWWNFQAGCMGVKVESVREITEFEYNLMSDIFSGNVQQQNYFEIVHTGFQYDVNREEIQVHCGENGNLFLIKTEEGFIIDVYNQDDNINTMTVWEDELEPVNDDKDEIKVKDNGDEIFDFDTEDVELPDNINEFNISEFKKKYGKTHMAICNDLGYEFAHNLSDYLLNKEYFYLETTKHWYPITSPMYTPEEQLIADYLRQLSEKQ